MSKKTIRLTESDLKQYISKVVSEQKVSDTTAEDLWNNSKDRLDFKIKMNRNTQVDF